MLGNLLLEVMVSIVPSCNDSDVIACTTYIVIWLKSQDGPFVSDLLFTEGMYSSSFVNSYHDSPQHKLFS